MPSRLRSTLSIGFKYCIHAISHRWKFLLGGCTLCVVLGTVFTAVVLLRPMDTRPYLAVNPSGELLDREGKLLYPFLNEREEWCFVRDLDEISPRLIQATLAVEDHRFSYHPGVDPIAVIRALRQNLSKGRTYSGASTLTMQVVKFSERNPRSYWGKINQAVQAVRLHMRVSKEDILWSYLNRAPYGANLVGCEAAARRFFNKSARELTLAEAALLAALPKAPSTLLPTRYPQRALQRRNHVLKRMWEEGYITQNEYEHARRQKHGAQWYEFPRYAPHLAMRLSGRISREKQHHTTLDLRIQENVEQLVQNSVKRKSTIGNAAALVVDVSSAQVLARVGSADFWNEEQDGQVDLCLAPRSPGSALKPFTYAVAMQQNVLYACEVLLDDTLDKGLYHPENFDQTYQGLITAADALRSSRNVPAVTVLERSGIQNFYRFLKDLNFTTLLHTPEYYGLGLTLGNCEVKLEELVNAYLTLASLGAHRPLQYELQKRHDSQTKQLLSRGVALKIYEMLEQPLPEEFHHESLYTINTRPRVCWKTGTSQGYRDAWTILFNRQYLVGVWMGNNDGSSARELVGARAALPLAASILRSLPQKTEPVWPSIQRDLSPVQVCALSGLPGTEWCKRTRREFLPKTQYFNRRCDMHYPASIGSSEVIERWPASADGWNLSRISIPFIREKRIVEASAQQDRNRELRIVSPANRAEFILTHESQGDRIRLRSSMEGGSPIFWYLNETFLGQSTLNDPLYLDLQPGEHRLSCMTAGGEVNSISYSVFDH